MVKTIITETTEKYDGSGKLVERVVREEKSEDDTDYTGRINGAAEFNAEDVDKAVREYCGKKGDPYRF